ncbi:uncharacterized protein Tco_0728587 [Tanacetum coccineum]|uniref:DUF4218 domain-containing protein n=1 Tax=Tanacetum coccineum TaxID=301880 RepID=A0ABQ4YNW9_9ASTR
MENYLPWSLMHNFETQRDNDQNEEVTTNIKRDDIVGLVQDAMGIPNVVESADVDEGMMDDETKKILRGWSNKSCTMVLELFFDALEEIGDVVIPKSYYEANKIVSDLGFSYETWDAYPNDCMLFRGDDKFLDSCSICKASRYKKFNNDKQDDDNNFISKRKILAKQVHYFPLKPRLKRLFMSPHTTSQMTWHSKERVDDGLMRHPTDNPSWKMFDKRYLEFRCESRNVKLGLASDGFNPFRTMTISHPPSDKIDVYLNLLIDELKDLWRDGVSTYDASSKKTVYKKEDVFKKKKREELEKENKRERKAALRSEKRKMKEKIKGKGKMNVNVKQKATNLNEKEGVAGKTKDHLNARLDLKGLNIRPSLHPQETNSSIVLLPPACFTLGKDEKYQFLKLLKDLKVYVRNRARPEGCIAKGALMEECMTFCARSLKDIETKSTRPDQNYNSEDNLGSHFGMETPFFLDHLSMEQAHHYLLASTDAVAPYREFRFRTKEMDNSRVTPNSGVVVIASTTSFSSRKDKNLMSGELTYYRKLTDIIKCLKPNHIVLNNWMNEEVYMRVRHGVEGIFVEKRVVQSPTIENQQQNNPVDVVASDSNEEMEDELEAHISNESEEEFDDTIDDTSDNDGFGNIRDDESDND